MYLATAQAAPHPPGPTARLASPGAGASGRVTSVGVSKLPPASPCSRLSIDCLGSFSFTSPHQHTIVLIDRQALGMDDLFLQILDVRIVYAKLSFQGTIRHPALALEQCEDLSNHLVEIHHRLSESTSRSAFASCKSAVSNPSVNQLYTGASRSWASWRLPCCCQSRARLVEARSSSDLACWFWAIAIAWWKWASASVELPEDCCNRIAPLRRWSSASYQRSPVESVSVSASVSTVSPSSGSPRMPCASARSARQYGRFVSAPVAGRALKPWVSCSIPSFACPWCTSAQ